MEMSTIERIQAIRSLSDALPADLDGSYQDADTVLADIMEDSEAQIDGQAEELFKLFENATNQSDFMNLFAAMTGVAFDSYLIQAQNALLQNLDRPNDMKQEVWRIYLNLTTGVPPTEQLIEIKSPTPVTQLHIKTCLKAAMNQATIENRFALYHILELLQKNTNLTATIVNSDFTISDAE